MACSRRPKVESEYPHDDLYGHDDDARSQKLSCIFEGESDFVQMRAGDFKETKKLILLK